MSKSKHSKPDEFQKEQIRHLKKEIRRKDQQIRSLEKELGYSQNKNSGAKRSKDIDINQCFECGKGILKTSDYGVRKVTTCSLCSYRKVSK